MLIDRKPGGTLPLEVVISFPPFTGPAGSGDDEDIFATPGVEELYAAPHAGDLHLSARLCETGPRYSLDAPREDIRRHATEEKGLAEDRIGITGMATLFNDVLGELLTAQTSTLAFVVLVTLSMSAWLLTSPTMAVIGLLPNELAAAAILGLMGLLRIALDMMAITIAAIVIGIAVDDAIH